MKLSFPKIVIALVIAVGLLVGLYFYLGNHQSDSTAAEDDFSFTPEPAMVERAPDVESPVTVSEPVEELPPPPTSEPDPNLVPAPAELNSSDTAVHQALQHISPQLGKWLIPDEQLRKWVLSVDLLAEGKLPKRYPPLDYPMAKFAVEVSGGQTVMKQQNYARLIPLLDTLTALDVRLLADYYRAWSPLLEQAYREQGKPGSFHQRLLEALDNVIAVTPLSQREPLSRPKVLYLYDNDELEAATDLEKLCWRMGEDNTLNLQAFARSLRYEISQ